MEPRNGKLTWDQVDLIRVRHENLGEKQADLAREYGVTYGTMGSLLRYESWLNKSETNRVCAKCGGPIPDGARKSTQKCQDCITTLKEKSDARAWFTYHHDSCEVCGTKEMLKNQRNHHTDHNHTTGELRGYLCMQCNVAIGMSGENPEILERLASYLRERGFNPTREITSSDPAQSRP